MIEAKPVVKDLFKVSTEDILNKKNENHELCTNEIMVEFEQVFNHKKSALITNNLIVSFSKFHIISKIYSNIFAGFLMRA